jgi:hypothetical protein
VSVLLPKAAALLLGFLIVEILCRLFFWFDESLHQTVNSSAAWRHAWIDRRDEGIAIYRPGIDAFDPLLGWRNRAGFRSARPILGSREVSTNANGARGRREYTRERGDARRIVVIGDSFAFGWGVVDGETYAARLEESLPRCEVVNLGVGGYGTDQMLLMLESEGLRYRPDLVIVGLVSADTDRNLVSFRDFAKPHFVLDRGSLRLMGTPVPAPETWVSREPARLKSKDLVEIVAVAAEQRTSWRRRRAERLTWMLWKRIDRVARDAGARTLFVFAPHAHEIGRDGPAAGEQLAVRFAAHEGARLLNMGDEFRRRRRAGEAFSDGHWGAREHRLIARAIRERVRSEALLPDPLHAEARNGDGGAQGVAAER